MGVYIQVDYTNYEGDIFKIEISDSTYSGVIYQVQGKAVLEYPKVKTMDMLRGSTLKIQLEASSTDTWQTRLVETVGDKKLPVTFYKGGSVFWEGFVKPDGIFESFTEDYYYVNVQCIDGLGLLDNIKFLNSSDDIYQGSYSEIDLLTRCLELTGQDFPFRVYYMNLFYTVDANDPVITNQALETTYVNTDRYVKDDEQGSVFTAKEVLESILKKYGAFITQQLGVWHIVRIIDYYTNDTSQRYALYTSGGVFVNDYSSVMNTTLGSDIDSYDPCHAQTNQSKFYKAALGAYKVYYEYGLVSSILENPKVHFSDGVGTITGWTVTAGAGDITYELQPDGNYRGHLQPNIYGTDVLDSGLEYDYTVYPSSVNEADLLKFVIDMGGDFKSITLRQYVQITLVGDSGTTYYLNSTGEWTLSSVNILLYTKRSSGGAVYVYEEDFRNITTITANSLPEDGDINIVIYRGQYTGTNFGTFTYINTINIAAVDDNIKGESYTSIRLNNVTAIVDTEDKVYVGDNDSDSYIGAIEDSSAENTVFWSKEIGRTGVLDLTKQFKLLNWLSRDRMQISGGNQTVFKGGILGYLEYLGVLTINNVTGVFMTTAWSYDTANNTITAEHERIFTDDIYSDVEVEFALESENVVKPAIE